jgi:methylenetetrahydrofolate dehydrogenase (NADP+)/methenyltetrahydrofolate cyclohydrolase
MTAALLDGKQLAQTMQEELRQRVAELVRAHGVKPGLAAVLVGERPDSQSYVRSKRKACEKVGMESWLHALPAQAEQGELLALIARLNAAPAVHGILVQLPLPAHLDEAAVVDAVAPLKDVDGFGPENLGLLAAGRPRYVACTPAGVVELLKRHGVGVAGQHVVIVGRSNIVGKPLAILLMQKGADATVTVCHSRTRDVATLTRQADVVVMAIGRARYLRADMVKPGAVVVDVGMNRLPDNTWAGDVDFEGVRQVAAALTPGARRGRADDHHHAAAQHARGGPAPADAGAGRGAHRDLIGPILLRLAAARRAALATPVAAPSRQTSRRCLGCS